MVKSFRTDDSLATSKTDHCLALKLAFHYMASNSPCFPDGSRGAVVLISSLSGYFGGTSVIGYVSSKHGITGLLRSSQEAAKLRNLSVNAVAPIFTPTYITKSYSREWAEEGLPSCSASQVAKAISQVALVSEQTGKCFVASKFSFKAHDSWHD